MPADISIFTAPLSLKGQDWPANIKAICDAIDHAVTDNHDILLLPELTLPGPGCADYAQYTNNEETRKYLQYIADYAKQKNPVLIISVGHYWRYADKDTQLENKGSRRSSKRYNRENLPFIAQSLITNGQIMGMSFKNSFEEKDYSNRHAQNWPILKNLTFNLTLPSVTYLQFNGTKTLLHTKNIPAGNPSFSVSIKDQPFTLIQIIGDKISYTLKKSPETHIILNPTASMPGDEDEKYHQKIAHVRELAPQCIAFASVEPLGNVSGRIAYEGRQIVANPATYIPTPTIQNPVERELRNHAYWLFDYMCKSKHKSLALAFSNGFSSVYTAAKVRRMVEILVNEWGSAEIFLQKLGYSSASKKTESIDDVLSKILICVYAKDDLTTLEEIETAQAFVQKIGGSFRLYDIQSEIDQHRRLLKDSNNPHIIARLKDRTYATETLGVGNMTPGCLGISTTDLDKLCLDQTLLGGTLHSGQLGWNQQTWRHEMLIHMTTWNAMPEKSSQLSGMLLPYIQAEEQKQVSLQEAQELTAAQTQFIFTYFLHKDKKLNRRPNPIELFQECRKHSLFDHDTAEMLYQKIIYCLEQWAKAQVNIHMAPISNDYAQKAVNHDYAQRTPNFNGFHRAECALLALYSTNPDWVESYKSYVFTDEKMVDAILNETSFKPLTEKNKWVNPEFSHAQKKLPFIHSEPNVPFKIATAVCNQTSNDWNRNLKNIFEAIDKACEDDADLLCFQELTLTGYGCDDYFEYTDNKFTHHLLKIIAQYAEAKNPHLILSMGHPWKLKSGKKPYNVQSFIAKGDIIAMSAKNHLYNYECGYEKRYFEEWNPNTKETINIIIDYCAIPFGNPIVLVGTKTHSIYLMHAICEDSWIGTQYDNDNPENYEDNLIARVGKGSAPLVVINPNTSPASKGKISTHQKLAVDALRKGHATVYVHTNTLGTESSGITATGTNFIWQKDSQGQIIKQTGSVLSMRNISYFSQTVMLKSVEQNRFASVLIQRPFYSSEKPDITPVSDWSKNTPLKNREYEYQLRTELLWLFDVMRKKGIHGFVQALSGGMDSAYNILKLRLMAAVALQEYTTEEFLDELHYPEEAKKAILAVENSISNSDTQKVVLDKFMELSAFCITLPTINNSLDTQNAARTLIEGGKDEHGIPFDGIGGNFEVRSIQNIMDEFLFSHTGIDAKLITLEQKAEIIKKLRLFASLRRDEIQLIFNATTGNSAIDAILGETPRKLSTFKAADYHNSNDLKEAKQKEEKRLREILCAEFKRQIVEILGHDDIPGTILSPIVPEHGIFLENKQARLRKEAILAAQEESHPYGLNLSAPSNPNKSESANSYTTFAGDEHSGYYAFNAHIHKALQIKMMQYLYEHGLHGVTGPIKALHHILNLQPTAELQPLSAAGGDSSIKQTDEGSMRRTYAETEIITNEMLMQKTGSTSNSTYRLQTPIEVFERCRTNEKYIPVFGQMSAAELGNKLLESYGTTYWISAQHKIECAPIAMTYGKDIDHKLSLQTPLINAYQEPELTQLILHCLYQMAKEKRVEFNHLTGGLSLDFCLQYAILDQTFAQKLRNDLWAESEPNVLGCPRVISLEHLYHQISSEKAVEWKENFKSLTNPETNFVAKCASTYVSANISKKKSVPPSSFGSGSSSAFRAPKKHSPVSMKTNPNHHILYY